MPKRIAERTSWGGIKVSDTTFTYPRRSPTKTRTSTTPYTPPPSKKKSHVITPEQRIAKEIKLAQRLAQKLDQHTIEKETKKLHTLIRREQIRLYNEQNRKPRQKPKRYLGDIQSKQTLKHALKKEPISPPYERTEGDERRMLSKQKANENIRRNRIIQQLTDKKGTRAKRRIIELKNIWAERDAQQYQLGLNLMVDYMCTMCNRPFSTIRRFINGCPVRCPSCQRFARRSSSRAYRQRNREYRNAQSKQWRKDHPTYYQTYRKDPSKLVGIQSPTGYITPPINLSVESNTLHTINSTHGDPSRGHPSPITNGPVVVWSPD